MKWLAETAGKNKEEIKASLDILSDLSKASLETLSIIIYKGIASRAEVDYIH